MTSRFINLIVNVQPKILKWDPNNPANCNITFSYSLASAHDSDKMRSSLTIGEHNVVMTDVNRFKATYILQDTKNASQAGVDVYDPDLQKLTGVTDGTAVSPAENSIDIDVQIDVGGTYRFLFWAIDDHPETDKAHRRKPALEVNKEEKIHSSANFAYRFSIILEKLIGAYSTVPAAQYGADEQRKVINWKQDNTQKWIQAGISTYTKWKWWDGQKYQVEEQVQINQPAEQAIRALKRVACFSWDMHSLDGSNGSIVVFPKKWYWGERSYIAASHNSPGLDKIKDKTIYFISDLPDNSLSHLVCVFILACSGQSGSSGTVDMVDQIYSKGAGFVGTIIGGDLAERTGWLLAKKFWNYAAKGGVDENGKLTPLTLPKALKKAFEEVYSEEGQKKFKPYSRRDGYLWPARGGKDDTALRAMGPTP